MWKNNSYFRLFCSKPLSALCRNYSVRPRIETHYDVLNLPRNCTSKQIKDAFIKLSKEYHPDRNKSKESQERFVKISNAYNVLSKSDSRRNYDLGLPRLYPQSFTDFNRNYHEVPLSRNAWDDPFFYRNRDKTRDEFYEKQPYYGIQGVDKLPNKVVAMLCILIASVGVFLQVIAVRRDEIIRRSNEAAEELQRVKNRAEVNGHEKQVELLEQRFRKSGILNDEK